MHLVLLKSAAFRTALAGLPRVQPVDGNPEIIIREMEVKQRNA